MASFQQVRWHLAEAVGPFCGTLGERWSQPWAHKTCRAAVALWKGLPPSEPGGQSIKPRQLFSSLETWWNFLARFCTSLGPTTPTFSPSPPPPFWNGIVHLLPVLPLYFGSITYLVSYIKLESFASALFSYEIRFPCL